MELDIPNPKEELSNMDKGVKDRAGKEHEELVKDAEKSKGWVQRFRDELDRISGGIPDALAGKTGSDDPNFKKDKQQRSTRELQPFPEGDTSSKAVPPRPNPRSSSTKLKDF